MTTHIKKRGASLAVRIPIRFCRELGLVEGSEVDIKISGKSIVIKPMSFRTPTLKELLAGITEENRHPETDWGPPVGKEIW